jgi:hypothetical protein
MLGGKPVAAITLSTTKPTWTCMASKQDLRSKR